MKTNFLNAYHVHKFATKYFRIYWWRRFNEPKWFLKSWYEQNRLCIRIHIRFVCIQFGLGEFK